MGATFVTASIANPADPSRRWESLFLVDTGATDRMVPGCHLREIGVERAAKRTYELAKGEELEMEIGIACIEFMGEPPGATVIFGPDDVEPILGVTALESAGVEVDPKNQQLKRLPSIRLKRSQRPHCLGETPQC